MRLVKVRELRPGRASATDSENREENKAPAIVRGFRTSAAQRGHPPPKIRSVKMTDEIRLSAVMGKLRARGYACDMAPWMLRDAAVRGRFPAFQRNFIWHVREGDLEAVAEGLRLAKRPTVAA
jgi:hypothetical protein